MSENFISDHDVSAQLAAAGHPGAVGGGGDLAARSVNRRRTAAVGVLAALVFAVTFAVASATKPSSGSESVAQPAPALAGGQATPARITAILASPAVPALKHVKVKKPAPAATTPTTVQSTPATTFAPTPPAPQAPPPTHTTVGGGGTIGGGGGTIGGGGGTIGGSGG